MSIYILIKLFSLFLAIWFSELNLMKFLRKQGISYWNFIIQCGAIVIFIALQFNLI